MSKLNYEEGILSSLPNISVQIGGQNIQLVCEPGEEESLRAAADLVNTEITSVQGDSTKSNIPLETAAIVSALNFAAELLRQNSDSSDDNSNQNLAQLVDKINSVLPD